jgi:hypothetical protein
MSASAARSAMRSSVGMEVFRHVIVSGRRKRKAKRTAGWIFVVPAKKRMKIANSHAKLS